MTLVERWDTHRFTGGNLQDLCGEPDGSLDTKVLVLCPIDKIGRDCEEMSMSDISRYRLLSTYISQDF